MIFSGENVMFLNCKFLIDRENDCIGGGGRVGYLCLLGISAAKGKELDSLDFIVACCESLTYL